MTTRPPARSASAGDQTYSLAAGNYDAVASDCWPGDKACTQCITAMRTTKDSGGGCRHAAAVSTPAGSVCGGTTICCRHALPVLTGRPSAWSALFITDITVIIGVLK